MAASYVGSHADTLSGLVLLGAYSTVDISDTGLDVLSIYGSRDGVMNREKYKENLKNLPKDYNELVIEGGSHAYFGMYGEQEGDGVASVSPSEQIIITAERICEFFGINAR